MNADKVGGALIEEISRHFQPEGRLAELLHGFEHRREQVEMADGVTRSLFRGEVGFFEAGTGTGKSLAYLIPAAAYAISRKRPVVISTYTISLQEQLIHKDIPLVQRIFPELKAVLVKGWRNYICHQRLDTALQDPGDLLDPGLDTDLLRIAAWAEQTEDGTRSELPFEPAHTLWDQVCAESDSCLRNKCPHYDRCHLFRDRTRMNGAHLLVVNHHLLFADVAVRQETGWETDQGVLPSYEAIILDEAHHVEDVATDYLGASLSTRGVAQLFGRIYRRRQGRGRGIAATLQKVLAGRDGQENPAVGDPGGPAVKGGQGRGNLLEGLQQDLIPAVHQGEEAVQEVMTRARRFFAPRLSAGGREKCRIGPDEALAWEEEMRTPTAEASRRIHRLAGLLAVYQGVGEADEEEDSRAVTVRAQIDAVRRRLSNLVATLGHFTALDTEKYVYWLEESGRAGEQIRLVSAPIDVGPSMLEWVEAQCESLVFVSATLSVQGSFDYTRERLGLRGSVEIAGRLGVREGLIASPFDYPSQALLAVADNLPDPSRSEYAESLPDFLLPLLDASQGRALVLFTSFALLERVQAALRRPLRGSGMQLLVQREAPRSQLLDTFRTGERAVLLGTDSFWEGIDVPGDALSLVILTRLPFDVPTEPITLARAERLRQLGRSSFGEYTLPRAVLKLKQGFGRLIRTRSDRGAVVICDRRVREKAYGRVFVDSLPGCRRVDGSSVELAEAIHDFLS